MKPPTLIQLAHQVGVPSRDVSDVVVDGVAGTHSITAPDYQRNISARSVTYDVTNVKYARFGTGNFNDIIIERCDSGCLVDQGKFICCYRPPYL